MPKNKIKKSKPKKTKKEEPKEDPKMSEEQRKTVFLKGIAAYNTYKKDNPNGKKKMKSFLRKVFREFKANH